jgi:hypothetical protein
MQRLNLILFSALLIVMGTVNADEVSWCYLSCPLDTHVKSTE